MSQYDKDHPHKLPNGLEILWYIYTIARRGRNRAADRKDSREVDTYQHILDNVKILIDKLG